MIHQHPQLALWQFIHHQLLQQSEVVLLYVLHSFGSSPGRQGFSMAVAPNHCMHGSIGGGIMEHKFVELAKEQLHHTNDFQLIKPQHHSKSSSKNQSGMICSGEQMVYLQKLNHQHLSIVDAIIDAYQKNAHYSLIINNKGINFSLQKPSKHQQFSFNTEQDFSYIESLGFEHHVHIVGGGHCSLALSQLMQSLHFYVHVYDTRPNLHTLQANQFAHQITILESYQQLQTSIPPTSNDFIVIMTFGYRTDDEAIRAVLHHQCAYIGVLGSKNKLTKLWQDYASEGLDVNLLQKFRAPIGLPIKSKTPMEIAVSIAAEIIAIKNA